ncbi:MAG: hypothetical protein JWO19_5185 [Bryobacterales bacterium]|nr:hypothetical protein [Bryobacterales bacterium]
MVVLEAKLSESRRHPRVQYAGLVFISWKTFQGERNYALGKCLDVSELGVGLELSIRIPVGSFVRIRAYGLNLDGSATVRHIRRRDGRYFVGLELSEALQTEILADLYASQTDGLVAVAASHYA